MLSFRCLPSVNGFHILLLVYFHEGHKTSLWSSIMKLDNSLAIQLPSQVEESFLWKSDEDPLQDHWYGSFVKMAKGTFDSDRLNRVKRPSSSIPASKIWKEQWSANSRGIETDHAYSLSEGQLEMEHPNILNVNYLATTSNFMEKDLKRFPANSCWILLLGMTCILRTRLANND